MRFMWKDVGLSLSIASGTWGITSTKVILVNKDIIMLTSDQIVSVVLDPIDASFEVCLLTLLRGKNCNGKEGSFRSLPYYHNDFERNQPEVFITQFFHRTEPPARFI